MAFDPYANPFGNESSLGSMYAQSTAAAPARRPTSINPTQAPANPYQQASTAVNSVYGQQQKPPGGSQSYSYDPHADYLTDPNQQAAAQRVTDPAFSFDPASPNRTTSPQGWDFTGQGVGEQYFDKSQGGYAGRTEAGDWWDQNKGGPATSNYSRDAYNDFVNGSPANLDPYYDNAKRKLTEGINQQFASRGAYGSSTALDRVSEGLTDLNAAQANAEANYGLQRYGLGGTLAGGADANARGNAAANLGYGQYAQGLDQGNLSRLQAGQNAANSAQELRRERGRDYMGDVTGQSNYLTGLANQGYNGLLDEQGNLLDATEGLDAGTAADYYNQQQQKKTQSNQQAQQAAQMATLAAMVAMA